ncbi:NHLP leader peptide family natural product precursor [Hassallia byssoidea VB512170]|uniref:NHLP leader peptide family natural product n=1 Tax=Hassallia byssoidea VB512170 TaxID=1304833 RepID=A0A846HH81_9CYAN|nr:NHLP leader peptide family RiPP precursor [Hassalia byssoidea]NEU76298.1 NHLP leader peptide family natural product precursor [Hassalia byssoidea VB512170]
MHDELKKVISQAMNTRFEFEQKLIQQAWENEAFKQELLNNPKAVYARESGEELPKDLEIEVIQETANKVYLVIPNNPASSLTEGELAEEALEAVAGGVCLGFTLAYGEAKIGWLKIRNANNKV